MQGICYIRACVQLHISAYFLYFDASFHLFNYATRKVNCVTKNTTFSLDMHLNALIAQYYWRCREMSYRGRIESLKASWQQTAAKTNIFSAKIKQTTAECNDSVSFQFMHLPRETQTSSQGFGGSLADTLTDTTWHMLLTETSWHLSGSNL